MKIMVSVSLYNHIVVMLSVSVFEGGWVRQNTTIVESYLLVRQWLHVSAVLGHLQVISCFSN